ncbi:hypothetical protein ACFPYM_04760 [Methylobacterium hispanicum]
MSEDGGVERGSVAFDHGTQAVERKGVVPEIEDEVADRRGHAEGQRRRTVPADPERRAVQERQQAPGFAARASKALGDERGGLPSKV